MFRMNRSTLAVRLGRRLRVVPLGKRTRRLKRSTSSNGTSRKHSIGWSFGFRGCHYDFRSDMEDFREEEPVSLQKPTLDSSLLAYLLREMAIVMKNCWKDNNNVSRTSLLRYAKIPLYLCLRNDSILSNWLKTILIHSLIKDKFILTQLEGC